MCCGRSGDGRFYARCAGATGSPRPHVRIAKTAVTIRGRRKRPDPLTCVHNRGPYDDYEAHSACGCASSRTYGQPTMVCECELHGDVTPLAKRTIEGLKSCIGCRDYAPP